MSKIIMFSKMFWFLCLSCSLLCTAKAVAAVSDFSDFSLEELMDISISSVSKREQKLKDVAAAISVVTAEDIQRRGVSSVPDALRLVPGVHVARIYNNVWAVSIRGFADRFSNKLLVLVDGQPIYSDVYAGVFWNISDMAIEDIQQIEVIRGPGASTWGVNAVNGVINIITKSADEQSNLVKVSPATDGHRVVVTGSTGLTEHTAVRYSVVSQALDRMDGAGVVSGGTYTAQDARDADDNWEHRQFNFRLDRNGSKGTQMLSYHLESSDERGDSSFNTSGQEFNDFRQERALARWTFDLNGGSTVTAYAAYKKLNVESDGAYDLAGTTYEVEVRHQLDWSQHKLVYGLNYKDWTAESLLPPAPFGFSFVPAVRDALFKGIFLQNEFALNNDLKVIVGVRADENDYTGIEYQPSLRFVKPVGNNKTIWGAISRAVKTPSRFENDIQVAIPDFANGRVNLVQGNRKLEPETSNVLEFGFRKLWSNILSTDITIFHHGYRGLTVNQLSNGFYSTGFGGSFPSLITSFTNGAEADLIGLEWAFDWQFNDYRFGVSGSYMSMDYSFTLSDPGTESVNGSIPVVPSWLLGIYFRKDISDAWQLDLWGQFVDRIEGDAVPFDLGSFLRVDLRLAYRTIPNATIALVAQNIGHHKTSEFEASGGVSRPYRNSLIDPVVRLDFQYRF